MSDRAIRPGAPSSHHRQAQPRELVEQAKPAEQAGFERLWISDHCHPRLSEQGNSPFVWSVIIAQDAATEVDPGASGYVPAMATQFSENALLRIYLNDHLAGATAGVELAKRLAGAERGWTGGDVLERLADEIAEDRDELLNIMAALDVPVRRVGVWAAWALEKVGRLKPNGSLVTRSPLSRVVELEVLRLGVEGKAAGWRTLRARAASDRRLDGARLDELIDRARRQIDELEHLRVNAAAEVFGGDAKPVDANG